MKTLDDSGLQKEIEERIVMLDRGDRARWGRMSVEQMICHLNDAFCYALGEKPVAMADSPVPRPVLKWLALRVPTRWPKSFPAPQEMIQGRGGTPPAEFERDRRELLSTLRHFCESLPRPCLRHPYFGTMTEQDWRRWGYLHTDHHLRQFGR